MPVLHVEFLMSQSRKMTFLLCSHLVTFLQGWLCSISCVIVNYIYTPPPLPEEDNSTGTIIGGFKADVYLILRVLHYLQSDRYPFLLTNGFRPTPLHI